MRWPWVKRGRLEAAEGTTELLLTRLAVADGTITNFMSENRCPNCGDRAKTITCEACGPGDYERAASAGRPNRANGTHPGAALRAPSRGVRPTAETP